jgi:hypothetical protein
VDEPKTRIVSPRLAGEEAQSEANLRPHNLEEYVGQERVKDNLRVFIEAARQRGEALEHVLLSDLPGSARRRWRTSSPKPSKCRSRSLRGRCSKLRPICSACCRT